MKNYVVYFVKVEPKKDDTETLFKLIFEDYIDFNDKDTAMKVSEKFKENGIDNFVFDIKKIVDEENIHNTVKLTNKDGIVCDTSVDYNDSKWDKRTRADRARGAIRVTVDNYLGITSRICNLKP